MLKIVHQVMMIILISNIVLSFFYIYTKDVSIVLHFTCYLMKLYYANGKGQEVIHLFLNKYNKIINYITYMKVVIVANPLKLVSVFFFILSNSNL